MKTKVNFESINTTIALYITLFGVGKASSYFDRFENLLKSILNGINAKIFAKR